MLMDSPIRAMVADSHPVVRTGLRDLLETEPGLAVVAEACDAREILTLVGEQRPDVVVLDMLMPGMTCAEIMHELKTAHPAVRILVLALLCDDPYAFALLRAGADACLSKNVDCDELVHAVKRLANGERVADEQMARLSEPYGYVSTVENQ